MGTAASSLKRLSSIMPAAHETRKSIPQKFSYKEIQLMETLLPSFVYREKSTETHRHIAAVHWEQAFKDPPVVKNDMSTRLSQREWRHTKEQQPSKITQLFDVFYAYLETHSPELKPVFRSSLHVRGRVLIHISVGMRSLITSDNFMDKIRSLTETHRRFGVKVEHYEPLGRALFYAMQVVSKDDWTPEVDDAWRRLFSHASVMLITAQRKVQSRVRKEAFKPIVTITKVEKLAPPETSKKAVFAPSMADLLPLFVLVRKASVRASASATTSATTGSSSRGGIEDTTT